MREPFAQLYLHSVWSTWDRLPLITPDVERRLYGAIIDKCRELKCIPIRIGGMPDHLHLLVRLPTTIAVATLMKETKGSSSHLMTHEIKPGEFFKWQGAYGAFTLRYEEVPVVKKYIMNQKSHHAEKSFRPEWEKSEINDEAELALEQLTDEEIMG
jgi:REP element-mobilizing transposase RayT